MSETASSRQDFDDQLDAFIEESYDEDALSDEYSEYVHDTVEDIQETLDAKFAQPILFMGSGVSQRYFDGPSWEELLEAMCEKCPEINHEFAYYIQDSDERAVGQQFSKFYRDWAWGDGRSEFPARLFDTEQPSDIYLKYMMYDHIESITPETEDDAKDAYSDEISALSDIVPQAIVTTNYDTFLESIFPEYNTIIGQEILTSEFQYPSQLFKIHGCVSDPSTIVVTEDDYQEFNRNKKYLSAKLLTYFAEHPVLIAGYSAQDPNVRKILSDIDRILATDDGFVDHIYLLERGDPSDVHSFERRRTIHLGGDRSITVKSIRSDSWEWVFRAFATDAEVGQTSLKLLRRLMNNVYDLVVKEAPRRDVEVNYQVLKSRVEDETETATLFGIIPPDEDSTDPTNPVFNHPYRPSDLAEELGLGHYSSLNDTLDELALETRIDIRKTNNKYHVAFFERPEIVRQYSEDAKDLLEAYLNGEEYQIELSPRQIESARVDHPSEYRS